MDDSEVIQVEAPILLYEFLSHSDKSLKLFKYVPSNKTERKIVYLIDDDIDPPNVLLVFKGNSEDAKAVENFLNNRILISGK